MKKIMIFIFCLMMSLSFGYASANAGPGCTIGPTNCIVGETGPQLTLSRTDPAGQKNAYSYEGSYDYDIYNTPSLYPHNYYEVIQYDGFALFKRNLLNTKSDYCSILGDNYYEVGIDKTGRYIHVEDTAGFTFMDGIDYYDYEHDVYYHYYGIGQHKAYEIFSKCNKFDSVQTEEQYDSNYIYYWKRSVTGVDSRVVYIPMSLLMSEINKLYEELSDNEKTDFQDNITLFASGLTIAQVFTSKATIKVIQALFHSTPSYILTALLAMMFAEDVITNNINSAEYAYLLNLSTSNIIYDQNTVFKLSFNQNTSYVPGMIHYTSEIIYIKDTITLEDYDYFSTSKDYGELRRELATYDNMIDAYRSILPASFFDSVFGNLW